MLSVRQAIGLLALPLAAFASKLPVQRFTTAEGLPRNALSCLTPGRTGVMWMCSTEGLIRYDGSGFRVFGPDDGLPSRVVIHAIASRTGGFWLITPAGICKLDMNSRISDPCKTIPGSVPADLAGATIFESGSGKIWFGAGHRVFEIIESKNGSRTLRETSFQSPLRCIIESLADGENGALYVGTEEGLFEFRESAQPQQGFIGSESGIVLGIEHMIRLSDGALWLATTSGPAKLIPGDKPKMRLVSKPAVSTTQVIARKDGSLWFAANSGLIQIDPRTHARRDLTAQDGLPHDLIEFIAEDSYGDLWGTTAGSGIFRLENSGIRAFYGPDGLGGPRDLARIAAIFEDRKGRLCVLTSWDEGSLRVLTDNGFKLVSIPYPKGFTGYGWGSKEFGFQARDGEWWIPSGGGLFRFSAAEIDDLPRAKLKARYDDRSGLHCLDVLRAFEDSSGDVWV
jgi:ligand-binding sensor domain-containing protein